MATLDEAKDALTFSDATGATNERADAHNIHHAAVFAFCGGEVEFEGEGGGVGEAHGDHGGAKDGDP